MPRAHKRPRLETIQNSYPKRDYEIVLHCPEFTSLCPFTGLPDFGCIDITYSPANRLIESKSLKFYLMAFRDLRIFNEDAVNAILEEVVVACKPKSAKVTGEFKSRGGVAIKVEVAYSASDC